MDIIIIVSFSGSPYLKHYNEVILKVVEHGHFLYWENDVVRQYSDLRYTSSGIYIKLIRLFPFFLSTICFNCFI